MIVEGKVMAPEMQLYVEYDVMVTVEVVVGVEVAVSVTLNKIEAGMIDVIPRIGAVEIAVEVTVRSDGVTVLVTHVVVVVIDRYELQKEVADDAFNTATTSLTARQSTMAVEVDDGSDELDVMTDDETTEEEADELVDMDDPDDKVPEEVFELDLPLTFEIGSLALLVKDDTLEFEL